MFLRPAACLIAALFLCSPLQAAVPDDPAVRAYVDAWRAADGDALLDAMQESATYRDSDNRGALYGEELARYVQGFRFARLEAVDGAQLADGRVRLDWTLRWPGAHAPIRFSETLRLAAGKVLEVDGVGEAPTAAQAEPVKRFLEAWARLDGAALAVTLAPEARLYDHENPAGIDREALSRIGDTLRGWRFEYGPLQVGKDGLVLSDYILHRVDGSKSSQRRLAFVVEDGLIRSIRSR